MKFCSAVLGSVWVNVLKGF